MHTPPCILVVDDQPTNVDILRTRLALHGYETLTAADGEEALAMATTQHPDLILLDILMPGMDGIEVCRRIKEDSSLPFIPIIIVTAKAESQDVVAGLEAGADEYLTKPLDQAALVARIKSMLRLKHLHDTVQDQTTQLTAQTAELEAWNQTLKDRVQEQLTTLERMGRLKRFLPPQVAELVVSTGGEKLLRSHRRDVTIVCCALQGFAAFVDKAEPDSVIEVLRDYYRAMGQLISQFAGTLERFAGDELVVVFNAPLSCPDPTARAVRMALAMCQQLGELRTQWRSAHYALDFGVGVAHGQATLGMIGFDGRVDYAVMGPVRHLALRLCDAAQGGKLLVSQCVWEEVKEHTRARPAGELSLEGQDHATSVFEIIGVKT